MTSAAAVLDLARAEIGRSEDPFGTNRNCYAAEAGHADGHPWCATFQVAVFRRAGMRLGNESAYTPSLHGSLKQEGRAVDGPRVGAVVFFHWPKLGRIAHVGLVESVLPDGRFVSIEGNTDAAGGRSGGRVMRKVRAPVRTFFTLPAYDSAPAAPGAPSGPAEGVPPFPGTTEQGMDDSPVTRQYQQRLHDRGWDVTVDGDHGPQTTTVLKAFQTEKGLAADGVGGPVTWEALWTAPVT